MIFFYKANMMFFIDVGNGHRKCTRKITHLPSKKSPVNYLSRREETKMEVPNISSSLPISLISSQFFIKLVSFLSIAKLLLLVIAG